MVSQRLQMLRGTNVKPAGGNHRAIPLQRAELTHRGQIGHLQFLRAAPLDGIKKTGACGQDCAAQSGAQAGATIRARIVMRLPILASQAPFRDGTTPLI